MRNLIIFSHLRWEFVTQRPQHIVKRLSRKRNILFIEEPVSSLARIFSPTKSIAVAQLHAQSIDSVKFKQDVKNLIDENNIHNPVLWFYSPTFVDMAFELEHEGVVYDCMDELSLFKEAPLSLITQEKKLLSIADIVFAGGKSLYESKKRYHKNVYCFPSSVDRKHFEKTKRESTIVPKDLENIQKPIVGYVGVIDERINIDLIDQLSQASPETSFVLIGPVVKIDPSILPKRKNIHYLGGKPYKRLPNYLKGIDIAMMPFALNDATKFISPTKTLEFIAAGKPIISTPIFDVVRDYKNVVKIVNNSSEFLKAINDLKEEMDKEKVNRAFYYDHILENTSWDKTVLKMEKILDEIETTDIDTHKQNEESLDITQTYT